jgi:DNA topoisomerase-1
MEDKLDGIANGTHKYVAILKDFYGPFHKEVKSKEKVAKATDLGAADPKFKCPKCGTTPMGIKLGRNGKFISCTRYPDCDGALTLDGHEFKKDEPIGVDPTTGLPIFVLNGRFGPYVQLGLKIPKVKKVRAKKVKVPKVAKVAGKKGKKGAAVSEADAAENVAASAEQTLSPETKSDQILVTSENGNTPVAPAPVKPKMASIPRGTDPSTVTVKDALKYLSLPRTLGVHPTTGKDVVASAGRFGPYVVSDGNYRSIKVPDNVYDIDLKRALEMLAIEKKPRGFAKKKKVGEK